MILTAPSYIIPGTYLENIAFLAGTAGEGRFPGLGGVELLFFIFDPETDELYAKERTGVEAYADRFIFTVHMPDNLEPGHEGIVAMTEDLARQYVLHPPVPGEDGGKRSREFINLVADWISRYGGRFLIENLIGRSVEPFLEIPGLGLCLDTGHLVLNGGSPAAFLDRHGERVRQIHLHGVADGSDHKVIDPGDAWFKDLVPRLRNFEGVLELEVFDADTLSRNLEIVQKELSWHPGKAVF